MSRTIHTDILILGAGPAGVSAALFLAKEGIRSTIVDKAVFPRDKICGDALSGKVVEVLKKLDPDIVGELYRDEDRFLGSWGVTFVAPSGEALRVPFKTRGSDPAAPGFISKRIDFDNWLAGKIKSEPLISVLEGQEIRTFHQTPGGISAKTKDGTILETKLLIAADGAYSAFAKSIGGLKTEAGHNCFGLRAYYQGVSGLDHDNFIELHFLKEFLPGYFWIFPLANGYANVGVGMRADKMNDRKINLKKKFEELLEQNPVLRERFRGATRVGDVKLHGLPLGSKKRKLSGAHYMLCGDAGQLIDPFTGEGIGNAMMSAMFAAHQAKSCLAAGDFSAEAMSRYDELVYQRLWSELLLSYRMQQLVNFPSLFNFVVHKANTNTTLRETISCMFEDINLRSRLKSPSFYFKLLFS